MFDVITEKEADELKRTASLYFDMLMNYQDFLDNNNGGKRPHEVYIKQTFRMSHAEFYEIRKKFSDMKIDQIARQLILEESLIRLKNEQRETEALKATQQAYFEACPSNTKRRFDADAIGSKFGLSRAEKQEYFNVKSVKTNGLKPKDRENILIEESISLLRKAQPTIIFDELYKQVTQIMNKKFDKRRVIGIYENLNHNVE